MKNTKGICASSCDSPSKKSRDCVSKDTEVVLDEHALEELIPFPNKFLKFILSLPEEIDAKIHKGIG